MAQSKQDLEYLELSQGHYAIIDKQDYQWLSQWKWTYQGPDGYAYRNDKKKKVYLHRFIMNTPLGKYTDHVNGNTLDNRRCNLRVCSAKENARNGRKRTDKQKGVYFYKRDKVWVAQIVANYKNHYLGRFKTAQEAAEAYDEAAKNLHGNFARINEVENVAI